MAGFKLADVGAGGEGRRIEGDAILSRFFPAETLLTHDATEQIIKTEAREFALRKCEGDRGGGVEGVGKNGKRYVLRYRWKEWGSIRGGIFNAETRQKTVPGGYVMILESVVCYRQVIGARFARDPNRAIGFKRNGVHPVL